MKDNVPVLTQCQEKDAPWNQEDPAPVQIDCTVCYCMSKSMEVEVRNLGEDTNLIDEFVYDPHAMGIPTLLKELQKLCGEKLRSLKEEEGLRATFFSAQTKAVKKEQKYYKEVLKAAQGWVVDDLDVCKDE